MDYSNMDILDIVRELKKLLEKFSTSRVNKTEIEQMRVLSKNLSMEMSDILYDWGK